MALLLPTMASNAGELPPDYGKHLATAYITPAIQHFHQSAQQLHAALQAWCPAADKAGAKNIKDNFAQLVAAWSGIEFLRFGPLITANRYEKISFWPDPRGITVRQVQGLLAKPDAVPDADALATHSVAVQGLPALEYVLYREGGLLAEGDIADRDGDSRARMPGCAYAVSIAGNLTHLGHSLAQEWGPAGEYTQKFTQPSSSNPLYRNQQEVAGEAIKALSTGLQFARDVKLLPVLGRDAKTARFKRAPFWRSGLALHAMNASAEGMLRFYQAGNYRYGNEEEWIDGSVRAELRRIVGNFAAMIEATTPTADHPGGFTQFVETEAGYRQLTLATLLIKNAKSLIDEDMAPAFGVRIGFNALDGD